MALEFRAIVGYNYLLNKKLHCRVEGLAGTAQTVPFKRGKFILCEPTRRKPTG